MSGQLSNYEFRRERILKHATNLFGNPEEGVKWAQKPCEALGMRAPLDVIDTKEGFYAVLDTFSSSTF